MNTEWNGSVDSVWFGLFTLSQNSLVLDHLLCKGKHQIPASRASCLNVACVLCPQQTNELGRRCCRKRKLLNGSVLTIQWGQLQLVEVAIQCAKWLRFHRSVHMCLGWIWGRFLLCNVWRWPAQLGLDKELSVLKCGVAPQPQTSGSNSGLHRKLQPCTVARC